MMAFGYFLGDLRDEEEDEMIKYMIVEEENQVKGNRLSFLTYVIVYFLVAAIVYIFRPDFIYETTWAIIAVCVSLVAVIVASRNHDGYNQYKVFKRD